MSREQERAHQVVSPKSNVGHRVANSAIVLHRTVCEVSSAVTIRILASMAGLLRSVRPFLRELQSSRCSYCEIQ